MIPLPHSGYRRRVREWERINRSSLFTNEFIDWFNITRGHNQASNTLYEKIPFCFQGVAFIQQQAVLSLPQCQSICHTHSTPYSDHRNEINMESMESTTLLSRCWRIQDGHTQPISKDHRKERESQWIIPTPFSRILQAMKEWIIGWVGIWMGESKTIVFWKVKQWCWLDGVTNRRESVLRPFVWLNRFTKQSLFMDWPWFSHSFDGIWTRMLINESKMEEWVPKGSSREVEGRNRIWGCYDENGPYVSSETT